jgi:hypothetical protein
VLELGCVFVCSGMRGLWVYCAPLERMAASKACIGHVIMLPAATESELRAAEPGPKHAQANTLGLHRSHRVAVVLLVIFGQNVALAIVVKAYDTAKERYGLPRTSFVMLIPLRIMFFVWLWCACVRGSVRGDVRACTCGATPNRARDSMLRSSLHGHLPASRRPPSALHLMQALTCQLPMPPLTHSARRCMQQCRRYAAPHNTTKKTTHQVFVAVALYQAALDQVGNMGEAQAQQRR